MSEEVIDRRSAILLAALECSDGDLNRTFTAEELLVAAWKKDPIAFGLRGFEREHPASEVIHREIGKRGPGTQSMVQMGLLEQVDRRVYRLTVKGLQKASSLRPGDKEGQERVSRELESSIRDVLNHRVFQSWLRDPHTPKSFRDAGQFWGVAPGTPPRVIRERIRWIDDLLDSALAEMDSRRVDQMMDNHGRMLFDKADLERCREFQRTLKTRFESDLELLGVPITEMTVGRAQPSPESAANVAQLASRLTQREKEILALLSTGATTPDIARELSMPSQAVKTAVQTLVSKMGVGSRLEAVALAVRTGLAEASNGSGEHEE